MAGNLPPLLLGLLRPWQQPGLGGGDNVQMWLPASILCAGHAAHGLPRSHGRRSLANQARRVWHDAHQPHIVACCFLHRRESGGQ